MARVGGPVRAVTTVVVQQLEGTTTKEAAALSVYCPARDCLPLFPLP